MCKSNRRLFAIPRGLISKTSDGLVFGCLVMVTLDTGTWQRPGKRLDVLIVGLDQRLELPFQSFKGPEENYQRSTRT